MCLPWRSGRSCTAADAGQEPTGGEAGDLATAVAEAEGSLCAYADAAAMRRRANAGGGAVGAGMRYGRGGTGDAWRAGGETDRPWTDRLEVKAGSTKRTVEDAASRHFSTVQVNGKVCIRFQCARAPTPPPK